MMAIVNSELLVSCLEWAFPLAESRCTAEILRKSYLVLTLQGEFKRRLKMETSRDLCHKCYLAKMMDDQPEFAAVAGGLGFTPRCPMPSKLWVFSVA